MPFLANKKSLKHYINMSLVSVLLGLISLSAIQRKKAFRFVSGKFFLTSIILVIRLGKCP
jgi:hypothetical protein